jgi:hypothetical protein
MKLGTTANARFLKHLNREIGRALRKNDGDALRALLDSIEITIDGLQGSERAYAEAMSARVVAGLRYVDTRYRPRPSALELMASTYRPPSILPSFLRS